MNKMWQSHTTGSRGRNEVVMCYQLDGLGKQLLNETSHKGPPRVGFHARASPG